MSSFLENASASADDDGSKDLKLPIKTVFELQCCQLYRITGKQSVERLEPLLKSWIALYYRDRATHIDSKEHSLTICIDSNASQVAFIWETSSETDWKAIHDDAIVLSRLHNSIVIENKANLAFLQIKVKERNNVSCPPLLETYVATSSRKVHDWATQRWGSVDRSESVARDWWVVKASRGNGGRDIWVMTNENFLEVVREISAIHDEEYVVQKLVGSTHRCSLIF